MDGGCFFCEWYDDAYVYHDIEVHAMFCLVDADVFESILRLYADFACWFHIYGYLRSTVGKDAYSRELSEGYGDGDVGKLRELFFYIIGEFGGDGIILGCVGLDEDDFSVFV